MCGSMVDIQCAAAEIRRGKKRRKKEEGKKLQGKNIMAPLLHRAAITSGYATWFTVGGAIRKAHAHYDVIDDVITRKL